MAQYFKAKNRRAEKVVDGRTPIAGEPNSNIDIRNDKGQIQRRRKLDDNGNAFKDYDFHEEDRRDVPNPHGHDWDDKKRTKSRTLDKKEMKEAKKAERKRRRFNNDK